MKSLGAFILCHLLVSNLSPAIEIDAYREFSSGVVYISLTEGEVTQSMELKWGDEGGEAAEPGPVLQTWSGAGDADAARMKLDARAAESLFLRAARLVPRYGLPAASTSVPKSRDASQWADAQAIWSLARELFPAP